MKINFNDCLFRGNQTAVSIPDESSAEYIFDRTGFENNIQGLMVRDSQTLIGRLGLPTDTDPELLKKLFEDPEGLLKLLTSLQAEPTEAKQEIIKQSSFVKNLGIASDSITLVTLVYNIATSKNLPALITFLSGYLATG